MVNACKRQSELPAMSSDELAAVQSKTKYNGQDYNHAQAWAISVDSRLRTSGSGNYYPGTDQGSVYIPMDRIAMRGTDGKIPDSMLTPYTTGTGLELNGHQFSVTNPIPTPESNDYGKILTVTGITGEYDWEYPSVLADDHMSNGFLEITLTNEDIHTEVHQDPSDNKLYIDYVLPNIITSSSYALLCSIAQVRPSSDGCYEKIEFGFKNPSPSALDVYGNPAYFSIVTFDTEMVRAAQQNMVPKTWGMESSSIWPQFICRWYLASNSPVQVGTTIKLKYLCIALNANAL